LHKKKEWINIKVDDQTLQKLLALVPQGMVLKQLNKEWVAKTKFLEKLPQQKHKIKNLINIKGTQKIKFKGKPAHKWLEELQKANEIPDKQKEFIKWFRTEYQKQSIKEITGKVI
jgi:hypothetical protein